MFPDNLLERLDATLKGCRDIETEIEKIDFDRNQACSIAPALRMLYSQKGMAIASFCSNSLISRFSNDLNLFKSLVNLCSAYQDVFWNGEPLIVDSNADFAAEFANRSGDAKPPKIVIVKGLGFFALGKSQQEADLTRELFMYVVIAVACNVSIDDVKPLLEEIAIEQERHSIPAIEGRLAGRIAIITGGAQGFGKGIAEAMASEGAYIAVADLNGEGACRTAEEINSKYGQYRAVPVQADIANEGSVKHMIQETVLAFGGLDVLISNAGILIAGGLSDMTKESFDLVTSINYTGYFLCAKYATEPMKIQNSYAPHYMMDIIEINSKSGLEGSNKNFAYAGSKFGGVGLTQSFALELVEHGIKVNAICPGNLLDGPLWSDPEKGLFRQYLDSGKVPGAKTLLEVRKFYEAKVPMKRGCTVEDVARAIYYVIEQKYETGQAIPVTGGQIMLS